MTICYQGPLFDHSGYGEANRNAVAALDKAGVKVIAKSISYVAESSDPGPVGRKMRELCDNVGSYKVKILHVTPDQYSKHMEPGKYHIGHFFWETDRVPDDFAKGLKLMDEIWTGSEANVQAIRNSGIEVPVFVFPQAIDTEILWPNHPYKIRDFNGYKFYSIFEWIDRKNPEALLNAYWEEFEGQDDVCLIVKTYFKNFTLNNKRHIRTQIEKMKRKSKVKQFPKVLIYLDLMDRKHILRLHETGDCYVTPHRGEGWGLPTVEAMLADKPVITTGYGGVGEYIQDSIPFQMVPLRGMAHSSRWYTREQNWAEPDIDALKAKMRTAYNGKLVGKGNAGSVKKMFNYETVGKAMARRLKVIEGKL